MQLKQFIEIIHKYDCITDIIDAFSIINPGWIFETLWDLIFKFGYCDQFPRDIFINLIGNFNKLELVNLNNLKHYLEKNTIVSGNQSGCVDHVLQNCNSKKYILTTCKYFTNTDSHKIIDYDIQNIIAVIKDNLHIYKNYQIILLVNNKTELLKKVARANKSSQYITKYCIDENIMDINDLQKYYVNFINDIRKYNFNDYDNLNQIYFRDFIKSFLLIKHYI